MAVSRVDPGIQVRDVMPLQDVGREDRAIFAGTGAALGALGAMALLLSVIGTYAILSLSVTRRTREIGVRMALGASRGIFAFRLPEGGGPWGLPLLGAMMIAAGLLSAWVPARRALAIAPADALGAE